jgi:hypothetical protein
MHLTLPTLTVIPAPLFFLGFFALLIALIVGAKLVMSWQNKRALRPTIAGGIVLVLGFTVAIVGGIAYSNTRDADIAATVPHLQHAAAARYKVALTRDEAQTLILKRELWSQTHGHLLLQAHGTAYQLIDHATGNEL